MIIWKAITIVKLFMVYDEVIKYTNNVSHLPPFLNWASASSLLIGFRFGLNKHKVILKNLN